MAPEISPALFRAGSGEPLLLLHGFTGTWRHWTPVLAELVARYEVIAPTLAGHDGGPEFPLDGPPTLAAGADLLESHLDALGIETAHVAGNSMGGALALELAKRGRARSVIALAPGGGWSPGDGEPQRLADFFSRQIKLTRRLEPQLPLVMSRPGSRHMALRDIMRHGELVAPVDAVEMARSTLRCTVASQLIDALRLDRGIALDQLEQISCPVLLASPQHDRILPPALHAPRLRREIPGVESRTLPRCGHVPMWDDSRLIVATIDDFVRRSVSVAHPA